MRSIDFETLTEEDPRIDRRMLPVLEDQVQFAEKEKRWNRINLPIVGVKVAVAKWCRRRKAADRVLVHHWRSKASGYETKQKAISRNRGRGFRS